MFTKKSKILKVNERNLIKFLKKDLTKQLRKNGSIIPTWFIARKDSKHLRVLTALDPPGTNKEFQNNTYEARFNMLIIAKAVLGKIDSITNIAEVWFSNSLSDVRPSEDPNRQEAVIYNMFSREFGIMYTIFKIARNGKKISLKKIAEDNFELDSDKFLGTSTEAVRNIFRLDDTIGDLENIGLGTLYKVKEFENDMRKKIIEVDFDSSKMPDVDEMLKKYNLEEKDHCLVWYKHRLRDALMTLMPEKYEKQIENSDPYWDVFEDFDNIKGVGL